MSTYYDTYVRPHVNKLNKYDFTEILSDCYDKGKNDFEDIKDEILERYKELDDEDSPFYYLSNDEIMSYLSDRYNVKFDEIVMYRMRYCTDCTKPYTRKMKVKGKTYYLDE